MANLPNEENFDQAEVWDIILNSMEIVQFTIEYFKFSSRRTKKLKRKQI